ncbi:Do/DeqQ family serine protease [Reichenbachiella faecimaris]|uniref:Do/DeqQ family serine protease n=2 Tax=Reichenbachiella faecimaris TaxID=692418 RepID=A0A1W2GMC9_REIFA|nr:Do/DeqQ family serine protease [Reichenbachiella faecimaris]
MSMSNYLKTGIIAFLSAGMGVWFVLDYSEFMDLKEKHERSVDDLHEFEKSNFISNSQIANSNLLPVEDFVDASEHSTNSVVFIKNLSVINYRTGHWMDWFFEPRTSQRMSTGSGVILSHDGYIITNNHVIEDADEIEVVHKKRSYKGHIVGTDPSTDLAVIKIDVNDFPAIALGNSGEVKVGEWVLAVGNPFNLTSTVTAGIVSAKGRNINILKDKFPIESFIQTDAAINPGNSGGALVNRKGELIGINTAILSRTGSYAGYGFAVPVDIVKKVFNDIVQYGEVQKAFFGAEFADIDNEVAEELQINSLNGVIITHVQKGWAADKADLEKGDIVTEVNGEPLYDKAQLEEMIGYKYPGDLIQLTLKRGNKSVSKTLEFSNREGTTEILKRNIYTSQSLQASFESISKAERDLIGIKSGIRVIEVGNGFFRKLDIPEGFIITEINHSNIESPQELEDVLNKIRGKVIVSGITTSGRRVYYPFLF